MKNLIFYWMALCLFTIGPDGYAQNFAVGVRGGISFPNLTGGSSENPINTGYKSRLGSDFAIFAEKKFSDLISLQPMIEDTCETRLES